MSAITQFRSEGAGAAENAALIAVLEACHEGLAVIEGGCILHANRGFAQIFGYFHRTEVQGRPLAEFIPGGRFLTEVSSSGHSAGPNWRSSCKIGGVLRSGAHLPIEVCCASFHLQNRDFLVVGVRDSGQNQAEKDAGAGAASIEAIGHLVSGVSHDFNNLLTGILLYCDLLLAGLEPGSRLRGYVEEIQKAGGYSAVLIQQLLSIARPPAPKWQALSWNHVIEELRNLVSRLLGENIELVTRLAGDAPPVRMHPGQMRQIVLNLLLNSRDAMPQGGRITVTTANNEETVDSACAPAKASVELTIRDTGRGMDADARLHLFESFFTTKSPGRGNGLGLAMVQRMVKEHEGAVQVESEPGKGTCVTVRLPRAGQSQEQRQESKER